MQQEFIVIGNSTFTYQDILVLAIGLVLFFLVILIVGMWRAASVRNIQFMREMERSRYFETQIKELVGSQSELGNKLKTVAEISVSRQADLSRQLNERLDGVTHKLGQNLADQSQRTTENLTKLHERLAVIDRAQKNITELSSKVVSLQDVLANKQTRGAFGQGRMEAIIADGLPKSAYSFQATLSNNKRPDCLVHLPDAPDIVIDAKFPLEAFQAFKEAIDDYHLQEASTQLRRDMVKHINDIQSKYQIPGEVQDTSIMFVPSESIYSDLYEHFDDVIQKAYRARVVIVSPSMLMLSVQVMQAILKDAKMREQAHLIKKEVAVLLDDVGRLGDRVDKLKRHFEQAQTDIEQIDLSRNKIVRRAGRIEDLELKDIKQQEELFAVDSNKPQSSERNLLAGE